MKYCIKCGTQIDDSVDFCPNCGTPAKDASTQSTGNTTFQQVSQQVSQTTTQAFQSGKESLKDAVKRTKDCTDSFSAEDIANNTVVAVLPFLFGWIGAAITYFAAARTKSPFAMFQLKQFMKLQVIPLFFLVIAVIVAAILGLILSILCFVSKVVGMTILYIVFGIIGVIVGIFFLLMFISNIMCLYQAASGRAKEALFVSSFGLFK